jgi:4-amino-4-deoxy-L-arabinose transferase-like glycosyltransferase
LQFVNPVNLAVFGVIAGIWPWVVLTDLPQAKEIWYAEFIQRAVRSDGGHEPWWFYLVTVPWLILPWTPLAAVAIPQSWRHAWREDNAGERFVWVWLLSQIALLSLAAGKHKHYVLPALPALSLLAGQGVARWIEYLRMRRPLVANLRGGVWLWLGGVSVAVFFGLISSRLEPELTGPSWLISAVGVAGGTLGIWFGVNNRLAPVTIVVASVFVSWYVIYVCWLLPMRDHRRPAVAFAQRVRALTPPGEVLYVYGMGEAPVVFYLGWPLQRTEELLSLEERLKRQGNLYVVTRKAHVSKLEKIAVLRQHTEMTPVSAADTPRTPHLVLVQLMTPTPPLTYARSMIDNEQARRGITPGSSSGWQRP